MELTRRDAQSSVVSALTPEIDEIRRWQRRRVEAARESWEESKTVLEEAIGHAEALEKEYRAVSADVHRKMEALDLVVRLDNEVDWRTRGSSALLSEIDEIGNLQQARIDAAMDSRERAKEHLREAAARAEAREREYNAIAGDVQCKLEVLNMAVRLGKEVDRASSEDRTGAAEESSPVTAKRNDDEAPAVRSTTAFPGLVSQSGPLFSFAARTMQTSALSSLPRQVRVVRSAAL